MSRDEHGFWGSGPSLPRVTRGVRPALLGLWVMGWQVGAAQVPAEKSSFLLARLDSRSEAEILVGGSPKAGLWLAGVEANLRGGYRELNSAVGLRLGGRLRTIIVGARVARGTQGWYGGVALWSAAETRRVAATGVFLVYAPFQGSGGVGFAIRSARAFMQVSPRCRIGAYYSAKFGNGVTEQGAGPSMQLKGSAWGVTLDAVRAVSHTGDELRLTLRV
jgi:hypothetical protein